MRDGCILTQSHARKSIKYLNNHCPSLLGRSKVSELSREEKGDVTLPW